MNAHILKLLVLLATTAAGQTPVQNGCGSVSYDLANCTNVTTHLQRTVNANATLQAFDNLVFAKGNQTVTLPTAIANTNRTYTIVTTSAGTNAILTTGGQTISGYTKWTNTAVNKFVTVASNNTNWFVIAASTPP
jgi:hypothetical protein